jgi:hypothetical protein
MVRGAKWNVWLRPYLLTWNCRHIANARILPRIHAVLNDLSIPIPVICTPEEMVGNDSELDDA